MSSRQAHLVSVVKETMVVSDVSDQSAASRLWGRRRATLGGGTAPRKKRTEAQAQRHPGGRGAEPPSPMGPAGLGGSPGESNLADVTLVGLLACVRADVTGQLARTLDHLLADRTLLEGLGPDFLLTLL